MLSVYRPYGYSACVLEGAAMAITPLSPPDRGPGRFFVRRCGARMIRLHPTSMRQQSGRTFHVGRSWARGHDTLSRYDRIGLS
jgi:hypothetical protein